MQVSKLNICLLASGFLPKVGGLELVVHHLATALSRMGHYVVVVAPADRQKEITYELPYKVIKFGFRGSTRLRLTALLAVLTLYYVVRKFHVDVIHVHDIYAPGTWARYYKVLKKDTPIIGTPHGEDINIFPSLNYGRRLDSFVDRQIKENLQSFDMLTAISESVYNELEPIVGSEKPIYKIPNGIWISQFKNNIDIGNVRKYYGIPKNSNVVISVGRNVPIKGFEIGLQAIAEVAKNIKNIAYILVGRNMSPLIQKASEYGIAGNVYAIGELSQERLTKLYGASNIYLNTSSMESFGIATLEAMCCGLPCIVSDVPGNRDIVTKDFGILVKPRSPESIASAIFSLIDDNGKLQDLGKKAGVAAQSYDWMNIAKKYVKIYKEAIGLNKNVMKIL